MKSLFISVHALFLFLVSLPSMALVKPDSADIETQGWMMSVQVRVEGTDRYVEFCKGSLIDPYWVISAQPCFFDVYDTVSDATGSSSPEYMVVSEQTGNRYLVEEQINDGRGAFSFMMLHLKRAASEEPIALFTGQESELPGSEVKVYNNLISSSFQNDSYSPNGEIPGICTVSENIFFGDNGFCYMIANPQTSSELQMIDGEVIAMPEEADTSHPLNGFSSLPFEPPYFVIDYAGSDKFLCYEDLGAAVVSEVNGVATQVGMVMGVGALAFTPTCNSSFLNFHLGFSEARQFIDSTIAKGVFDRQCPGTTSIEAEPTGFLLAQFQWEPIENAEGYSIVFTPALGQVPVQSVNVGNITSLEVELEPLVTYSLAVQGYNSQCTGPLSETLNVQF